MSHENKNEIELEVKNLSFRYGGLHRVLENVNINIYKNSITALIGPSGCGKTTFLRCFNRMHDLYPRHVYSGEIFFKNKNILDKNIDLIQLRSEIGMVFQAPTPFPMTIFENIAYGIRLKGIHNKTELSDRVEMALKDSALWDEVKNKLSKSAYSLSGGQQQRLVIARAIAVGPEVLLFDEPTSSLDPISMAKIEETIAYLKNKLTIIIVTHNMQQAHRIADWTAFMWQGELIEFDTKEKIFSAPKEKLTHDYIFGLFG